MRSDAPAFGLGEERGERLWPSTLSLRLDTQGWTGKPLWRYQEGRFWLLSTPSVPGHPLSIEGPGAYPFPGRTPLVLSPLNEEGWTGWTGTKEPGKQGENVSTPSMDTGMDGDGQPPAPPGLAPRATPAPPGNPSRAREPRLPRYRASGLRSQARRPALPRSAESLPTAQSPVGTPVPWPQGRIPTTRSFPAPHRHQHYRTTGWQPVPSVRSGGTVGAMRGSTQKPNDLSDDHPFRRIAVSSFDSAIC